MARRWLGHSRRSFLSLSAALAAAGAPRPVRAAPPGGGDSPPGQAGVAGAPSGVAPDASAPFRAVVERLQGAMAAAHLPGAAIGIFGAGREEHAALGVASVESGAPVTPQTLFALGSVTKTYTATAIMHLAEAGRLDLDAPVRAILPHLRLADASAAEQVTLRHLLTHTGGWWGDYFPDTGEADDAVERYVAAVLPTLVQLAPVGQHVSYNNAGFVLLGRVIEVATGLPYRTAMQELVLEPLRLRQSFFAPQEIRRRPHAAGHATTGAEPAVPVSPLFLPRNADPAGGLWSTTHDQLRYARSHLGQRTAGVRPLLQPETLQSMRTPQVFITSPQPIRLGLSWLLSDVGGVPVMIHDGDTFGLHADLFLAPEHDFAFVLLTNAIPAGAIVAQPVLAEALVRYGLTPAPGAAPAGADGGPAPAPPGHPAVPPVLALPPEALAAYAGRYRIPPATIELRVVGDALLAYSEIELVPGQIVPTSPTTPSGALELPQGLPVTFVREDVATISLAGQPAGTFAFVRRPDGSVGWMRSGVRLIPRVAPPY